MSLRGDKYETLEEIQFRLKDSVVVYDDYPVYISDVGFPEGEDEAEEIARVYFHTLPLNKNLKRQRKFLSSRKFNLTPFKMGYAEVKGSLIWVERLAKKQYVQGLSSSTTNIIHIQGENEVRFSDLTASSCFLDFYKHNYRPAKESLELLKQEEVGEAALWHSFAATKDEEYDLIKLMHNKRPCGLIMSDSLNRVHLSKHFQFLKEEIKEVLGLEVY